MPKLSVLNDPQYVARLPKEGFNVSQSYSFTSSVGHLLPCFFDRLSYGDKVRISVADMFVRSEPLVKPAFTDVDFYVDFFFVPAKRIFSPFNQLERGVDDFASSYFEDQTQAVQAAVPMPYVQPSVLLEDNDAMAQIGDVQILTRGSETLCQGAYRLCDMLHINPNLPLYFGRKTLFDQKAHDNQFFENQQVAFSPLALCSYQAIYYDYYRPSKWVENKSYAYNLDYQAGHISLNTSWSGRDYRERIWSIFELHYRPYNRDYFKAVNQSPLLNSIGIIPAHFNDDTGNAVGIKNWLYSDTNPQVKESDDTFTTIGDNATSVDSESTNLAALSSAYAYRKMLAITNRAGRHFDDQVLAHFGFKVPQGIKDEVYLLGSHHQVMRFGEVISTAATDSAALGQLAGKGYSVGNSQTFTFTAPCIGALMAIYSAVPRVRYVGGMDKLHAVLFSEDYPQPEYMNLGQQPLFGYEADYRENYKADRLGWQYRYMEYKVKYPRASHAFYSQSEIQQPSDGPFRPWSVVLPVRRDYTRRYSDNLFVHPVDLNSVLIPQFITLDSQDLQEGVTPYQQVYGQDGFIIDLNIKCYKTSWMSRFGEEPL